MQSEGLPPTNFRDTSGTKMVIAAGAAKKQQNTNIKTNPTQHTIPQHNSSSQLLSEPLKSKRLQARASEQPSTTTASKTKPTSPIQDPQIHSKQILETTTAQEGHPHAKILSLINKIPTPKLPESTLDRITGGGEWSNIDLDVALENLGINAMPARFLVDLQDDPPPTIALLRTKATQKLYLPLWIRHHWLLGVLEANSLYIADSSPGIATKEDIAALTDLFAFIKEGPITLRWLCSPRQPRSSVECGLHVVINTILHLSHILQPSDTKPIQRVIEYEKQIGPHIASWLNSALALPQLLNHILVHIAEVGIELLTAEQVLDKCDRIAEQGPVQVTWVEVADTGNRLLTWTGNLTKRKAKAWTIEYNEREGYFTIPSSRVNYLMIASDAEDFLYEDLVAKNITVPTNHATLAGDQVTVAQIKEINAAPLQEYSTLFTAATAPSTRKTHNRMITLMASMPPAFDKMNLQSALLIYLDQRARARKWKSSTLLTKLASIQGACRLLPFYKKNAPSISLSSTVWKMALRGASYAANAEIAVQAPIITAGHMTTLISHHAKSTPDPVAALTELTWLVAGRVGDVAQLAPEDVTWDPNGVLMVRFRRGKTARRGQYSIATTLPSANTATYIQSRAGQLWIFPQLAAYDVKKYLRKHINIPKIEARSLRRGRLQLLSAKGMADDELLHVSRHQTLSSLRRYLNFGTKSGENLRRAKRVEHVLAETTEDSNSDGDDMTSPSSTS